MNDKHLTVLGIRGVPASHGGFETFAEYLCPYLVKRGWQVTVYCQEQGVSPIYESEWEGVKRIHISVNNSGPLGTVIFDFISAWHSLRQKGVFLTLGYNTAVFNLLHRLRGKLNVINMDGIEWKRKKWSRVAKVWFWLNERFGCFFGNHLVADHPRIEDHLATRTSRKKITMIPYGGLEIQDADVNILSEFGLTAGEYAIVVARPEPENSILEIVEGFSRKKRGRNLVVLGNYQDENSYHQCVINAASDEVIFTGGIYDIEKVSALRFFARCYVHGHQVGGTNPSLVEAIGAGNAILAHNNEFNRWVAKDGAVYFSTKGDVDLAFDRLFAEDQLVENLQQATLENFQVNFRWEKILSEYETLLLNHYPKVMP